VYVARWTSLHVRRLTKAIKEAIAKPGFSFVEIISPCPTVYLRRNKLGDGLAMMQYFKENSVIAHGTPPSEVDITMRGKIICGKFLDIDRAPHHELMRKQLKDVLPEPPAVETPQEEAVPVA
jgi:2-oxoglutarate ferredoxin oxidoreductase subunit beta